jgi:hypothetical protein
MLLKVLCDACLSRSIVTRAHAPRQEDEDGDGPRTAGGAPLDIIEERDDDPEESPLPPPRSGSAALPFQTQRHRSSS